ncbi:DEAD/DEAH box helicase [Alkaliphilus peptidifermentans]|uniref:Superfamily II DNA or RNA helicase n=1 Tax=Alkaliphilus peptidifermentans DSM 18978 TaxID=1120976 RepID=A0A1G5EJ38_9FIRM|nr:DEAD/DEAH box helicase family protein [Alkaliphilus peptidifermentans]SCY26700.1 Superfamily II DNA or RNA helicase [Alkaliphilus peptidifermentans DSM 18978]
MKSYFARNYSKLKYPKSSDKNDGLRNAQLGAIHSISSFFTVNKSKVAIIVMPTGSGKTAVLIMTPYVLEAKKILVVTPSRLVRNQITEEYSTLDTLIRINVLPNSIKKPKVFEMKKLFTEDQENSINIADVVVATPQAGLSISNVESFKRKFDLVLIDEAHHVPAKTWTEILENMNESKKVLFTATPFRMDNKTIKGNFIYNYPLSQAYKDGIFGEIQYIPIAADENKDFLIAKKAESIFLLDREKGYEHFLMVRASSKPRAKDLEDLYATETILNLKRIDSSMSIKTMNQYIKELRDKELDGIICVDMLGEGFDFPNLKIAAVHDPHKSLANTLQFIGRFARTNASNIDVAKFIAMNDDELIIENTALYKSDAIWQEIIIDLSESKIEREESEKEYISEYVIEKRNQVEREMNLSLHTIKPNCHAKLYKVLGFNMHGTFPEICNVEYGPYINKEDNTIVAIGKGFESPKWYTGEFVKDEENFLYVIHFQEKTNILYIYSQVKSEFIYEKIVEAFSQSYEKIAKHEINRVLGNLNDFEIFNSGMMNRFNESGESYRISAGTDVSQAIDPSTGKLYSAGHVFCKAFSDEQQITIGYSSGSKIWSSAYASLKDYIKWCDLNGTKIFNPEIVVKTNTNFDFLPIPKRLEGYPSNIYLADFSGDTYTNPSLVYDRDSDSMIGLITDFNIKILEVSNDFITLIVSMGEIGQTITCDINGKYYIEDEKIVVLEGRHKISLSLYLADYPLIFRTTDDVMIQGIEISKGDPEAIVFSDENIISIPWKEKYGTNVTLEFKNKKTKKKGKSIQDTLFEVLMDNSNLDYIIYDHSTGEIADFITIENKESEVEVILYHVKAMSAKNFNSSLSDIYEVTGQSVKSIIWLKTKSTFLQKIKVRRKSGHCEFKKGDYEVFLRDIKQQDKLFRGKIVAVQPSISKSVAMPEKIQEVLAATRYYISNSGKVKSFEIWGS